MCLGLHRRWSVLYRYYTSLQCLSLFPVDPAGSGIIIRLFFTFCFIQDIDECQVNTHNCHEDGVCINTDGSFRCECKVGFIGSGEICSGIELCQL